MFHILIVDDDEELLEEIRIVLTKSFPDSEIQTARTVNEGLTLIMEAYEKKWLFDLAVLDFKLPLDVGENDEVDESLCEEIGKYMKNTLVIHITSYGDNLQVVTHLNRFHRGSSESRPLFIDKGSTPWLSDLSTMAKAYLYGSQISARLDRLFGPEQAIAARAGSAKRMASRDEASLTIEFNILCHEISLHWKDLDKELQNRIKNTLNVDTNTEPVSVSLS